MNTVVKAKQWREAGAFARDLARQRRRAFLREHRAVLLKAASGMVVSGAAVTVLSGWLFGQQWAFFTAGGWVGASLMVGLLLAELLDGRTRQLLSGAAGEANTARAIRQLRSEGWTSVHNLRFEAGDVDHVAIGPGGVVVIETKSRDADWEWLYGTVYPAQWSRQAREGAFRVAHFVKQTSGLRVTPLAAVVLWARGGPDRTESVDGVPHLSGHALADHLRSLPPTLDPHQVAAIHHGLSRGGQQIDEYLGIAPAGVVRRALAY